MVKAEGGLLLGVQPVPIAASCLQQGIGADDVGLDEGGRAIDGAVHMAFGGQVHYCIGLMGAKDPFQFSSVAEINLLKGVTFAGGRLGQRFKVAGIGELVHIDHGISGMADNVTNDGGADKAGDAGNEDFHFKSLHTFIPHTRRAR